MNLHDVNAVAMGDKKADLLLENCNLVSVYTRETIPQTQVAVTGGKIAYVGPDAAHTAGPDTRTVDLKGRYLAPAFADPHIHIDQFVLPSEFAKRALLRGVTTLFSDSIDVVSVAGYRGLQEFMRLCADLPVRIFQTVPGGLPVDPEFSSSKTLTFEQYRQALAEPDVKGIGEVFSWTRVTSREPETMKLLEFANRDDCTVNGHTAGAAGKKLNAYVASGILSCHEPINFDQVLERLRLGMWVMVRDGSIRRDIKDIIPQMLQNKTCLDRVMFCSDGLDPVEMSEYGHIDHSIRESVKLGMDPVDAVTMASRNVFEYYKIRSLGGIAPGKTADMLVLDDLESFLPSQVYCNGRLAASGGKILVPVKKDSVAGWMTDTVRHGKFSRKDFEVQSKMPKVTANTIFMQTEIVTRLKEAQLEPRDGLVHSDMDRDIWKVAVFARDGGRQHTVGFLENFGAEIGAFASTWSFHENEMIVIGSDDSDMALAANHLVENQGGITVVKKGKVAAMMQLRLGGIISTDPFDDVSANFEAVNHSITDAGCRFSRPHLILLFLPFLALPSVRILSKGLVDIRGRQYIEPISNIKKGGL